MWNKDLKTLDYFLYDSVHNLGVFGPFFTKLPLCSSTQKTDITQSSDDLGRRVRPHLLWNFKLKTMDYIRRVLLHDLGYLGPVSPNLWPTDSFYTRLRSDYMSKYGVENFVLIFVYSCFYVIIKIILFSFRICINVNNWARFLSDVICNFVMKDMFVEQFFVLINPA